jgi:hypothetical protein
MVRRTPPASTSTWREVHKRENGVPSSASSGRCPEAIAAEPLALQPAGASPARRPVEPRATFSRRAAPASAGARHTPPDASVLLASPRSVADPLLFCDFFASLAVPFSTCECRRTSLSLIAATTSSGEGALAASSAWKTAGQQIMKARAHLAAIAAVDGIDDLTGLLDDITTQRREGLLAIPRAAVGREEALHQLDEAGERRPDLISERGSDDGIEGATHRSLP